MLQSLRPALAIFASLSLLTGLAYPLLVTGISQGAFHHEAEGSLIVANGRPIGSSLIGQNFTEPKYFWGRPSATGTAPYNPLASAGSNQGPLNPALIDAVKARIEVLRAADPGGVLATDLGEAIATVLRVGIDLDIPAEDLRVEVPRCGGILRREVDPGRLVGDPRCDVGHGLYLL